jgi:hypothetical protein
MGKLKHIANNIAKTANQPIELKGPFKKWKPLSFGGSLHTVVEQIDISGKPYFDSMQELMNVPEEDIRENQTHEFIVDIDWFYDKPDKSVGWVGGYEIQGYEILAIDELEILNKEDSKILEKALSKAIYSKQNELADEARKKDEENFDVPDDFYY